MKSQRGSSLIEVMVAMAMLSFALVYSMSSTDQIENATHSARDMAKANNIAVTLMEELISVYDSDPKLTDGSHSEIYDREGNRVAGGGYFTANWTVDVDSPITKVSDIRLTVTWTEGGRQRLVQLQTFRGT